MPKTSLRTTLGALCAVSIAGCGSSQGAPARDADPDPARDAEVRLDAELGEDAAGSPDGASPNEADAAVLEAGADAQTDSALPLPEHRAQICGQARDFPAPLPPPGQRTAQRVGTATFGFTEGPVWIAEQGVLLFSDMDFNASPAPLGPPGRIRRLTPPSTFDVFAEEGNCNGLALTDDGALLAATHDTQSLSRFDLTTAARTNLPLLAEGKHLNSPNDLAVRSDGTVYLTDPDWQLPPRSSETMRTGVYRVDAPLSTTPNAVVLVEGGLTKPNGIALSPDEQTLYVGSSGNEIWKYPVAADGSLGAREKFAEPGPSDGLTVDCAGNLYVTSGTVEVFAPDGSKLGDISVPGGPSNVAFGGADRKTLYITAGSRLYSIALNVPGYPY